MTGYSDEQIELMVARLGMDEYNQGVPRCAPWRTSPSCSGPDRWIVYQPTGSDQSRIITEGVRQPFADFIAAARELVPSLLARAQQAEAGEDDLRRLLLDETYRPEGGEIVMRELAEAKAEAVERLRQFNAAKDQRDAALADADRLRAELAEVKAENEALRQVAQSDRETAKDYADEIAAAHAERDRLAAQVAAVRSLFDGGPDTSCRTVWQNGIECVTVPLRDLRAALDGTEQDEAKAPIRATCSGGGPSTEPGMALIEFRVPQGTERRLGAEWLLTPVSRPTEGDEQ